MLICLDICTQTLLFGQLRYYTFYTIIVFVLFVVLQVFQPSKNLCSKFSIQSNAAVHGGLSLQTMLKLPQTQRARLISNSTNALLTAKHFFTSPDLASEVLVNQSTKLKA